MRRFFIWLDNKIGGNSTSARWGFFGVLIALILFLTSLALYFWGVVSVSKQTSINIAIILSVLCFIIVIIIIVVFLRWWKKPLESETSQQLQDIQASINKMDDGITKEIHDLKEEIKDMIKKK